jgi:hypothetical protein
MQIAVNKFEASGGKVIIHKESWLWHEPKRGQQEAMAAFIRELASEANKAPVRVIGGPEKMHSVAYRKPYSKDLIVSLANDFTWVETDMKRSRKVTKASAFEKVSEPPTCQGVKIIVSGHETPKQIFEVMSGQILPFRRSEGAFEVLVPEFQYMALIVIKF